MYPYLLIWSIKVYMTWIWITLSVIAFILLVYKYSKKYWLNFWRFFNWVPVFLLLPYIIWAYTYSLINFWIIIPTTLQQLLFIISPYGYQFNFIWLSIGFFLAIFLFVRKLPVIDIYKWIDVFFYSLSLSLVPLGFFLLLWDNFIWKSTDSFLWVSAFMEDSDLFKYTKVYPVWIFLSLIWIAAFISTFFAHYVISNYWLWFFGFGMLIFLYNFVFLFQQYNRYMVLWIWDLTFDVKNYWTLILIWVITYYYYYLKKR